MPASGEAYISSPLAHDIRILSCVALVPMSALGGKPTFARSDNRLIRDQEGGYAKQ
jgi:hypothetical protein